MNAGQASPALEAHPNQYNSALLNDHTPTADDYSPVGIAAEAASVKVSHIKIFRDIYYIAVFNRGQDRHEDTLTDHRDTEIQLKPADPAHPEKDEFFVLGDNSAQSSDGRLWHGQFWVERELLIGKALFIYWPHGWQIPYVPLPFNLVPYFQRMHLVR